MFTADTAGTLSNINLEAFSNQALTGTYALVVVRDRSAPNQIINAPDEQAYEPAENVLIIGKLSLSNYPGSVEVARWSWGGGR